MTVLELYHYLDKVMRQGLPPDALVIATQKLEQTEEVPNGEILRGVEWEGRVLLIFEDSSRYVRKGK